MLGLEMRQRDANGHSVIGEAGLQDGPAPFGEVSFRPSENPTLGDPAVTERR